MNQTPVVKRPRSRLSRFLSYVYLPVLGAGVLAILYLVLTTSSQVQDVKKVVKDVKTTQRHLAKTQAATCNATNKARRDSNEHIRKPLKRAVTIAGGGSAANRARTQLRGSQEAARFEALAKTEHDPAVKEILHVLATALRGNPKLTAAYAALASNVQLVPLLNCKKLAKVG